MDGHHASPHNLTGLVRCDLRGCLHYPPEPATVRVTLRVFPLIRSNPQPSRKEMGMNWRLAVTLVIAAVAAYLIIKAPPITIG